MRVMAALHQFVDRMFLLGLLLLLKRRRCCYSEQVLNDESQFPPDEAEVSTKEGTMGPR